MKGFKVQRANGHPMQWNAYGEDEADALNRWQDTFGEGFRIVKDASGKPLPADRL